MKTVHKKQNWKGSFTYQEGYEVNEQYTEVKFKMEIILTGNSFTGTSTDTESQNVFNKPTKIHGFVDDEKISFVMKYPCTYFKDDKGEIILDPSTEHPDIHYLGFFEDDKTYARGNWEMTIHEEKYGDGYLDEIVNGEFEMRIYS